MPDDVMTRMRLEDPPESTFLQKFGDFANAMNSRNLNHLYTGPQGREDRFRMEQYRNQLDEWTERIGSGGEGLTAGEKSLRSLMRESATGRYHPPPQRATRKRRTPGEHGVVERLQMREFHGNEWVDQEGSEVFQPNPRVPGHQYFTKGFGSEEERWRNEAYYRNGNIEDIPGTDHRAPVEGGRGGVRTIEQGDNRREQKLRRQDAFKLFGVHVANEGELARKPSLEGKAMISRSGQELLRSYFAMINDPQDKARRKMFGDPGFDAIDDAYNAIKESLVGGGEEPEGEDTYKHLRDRLREEGIAVLNHFKRFGDYKLQIDLDAEDDRLWRFQTGIDSEEHHLTPTQKEEVEELLKTWGY